MKISRIGVRPEDIYLAEIVESMDFAETRLSDPITFSVDIREPLGHAYELTLVRGSDPLHVWSKDCPANVVEGATTDVMFDLQKIHSFNENGEAIDVQHWISKKDTQG